MGVRVDSTFDRQLSWHRYFMHICKAMQSKREEQAPGLMANIEPPTLLLGAHCYSLHPSLGTHPPTRPKPDTKTPPPAPTAHHQFSRGPADSLSRGDPRREMDEMEAIAASHCHARNAAYPDVTRVTIMRAARRSCGSVAMRAHRRGRPSARASITPDSTSPD